MMMYRHAKTHTHTNGLQEFIRHETRDHTVA